MQPRETEEHTGMGWLRSFGKCAGAQKVLFSWINEWVCERQTSKCQVIECVLLRIPSQGTGVGWERPWPMGSTPPFFGLPNRELGNSTLQPQFRDSYRGPKLWTLGVLNPDNNPGTNWLRQRQQHKNKELSTLQTLGGQQLVSWDERSRRVASHLLTSPPPQPSL